MIKIKKFLTITIGFLLLCFILVFFYNNKANAKENSIKNSVATFNNKPVESIKILNKSGENYELSDDAFLYTIDSKYRIKKVIRKDLYNVKIGNTISVDETKKIGEKFLKKASLQLENYTLDARKIGFKKNETYTLFFKFKNSNGIDTGSFAYVDLFLDGTLKGMQIHNEDSSIAQSVSKISKEKAKTIVFNYLNTNTILKKYINDIQNNYKLESTVLHGNKIWRFTTKIPDSKYSHFQFVYLIDANTGEFLLKSEPKMPGFNNDTSVENRFSNLINKK